MELRHFVIHGKLEAVKETIKLYNFTVNQLNNMYILHIAAAYGKMNVCKYLISLGLDVNKSNGFMKTPLHLASRFELDICKYLLENGALIDVKDENDYTPLHYAAFYDDFYTCEFLFKYGADPNIRNNTGKTFRDITDSEVIRSLGSGEKTKVCR